MRQLLFAALFVLSPALAARRMHGAARFHQTGNRGRRQICRHLLVPQRPSGRQRADAGQTYGREGPAAEPLAVPASRRSRVRGLLRGRPRRDLRPARGHAGERLRQRFRPARLGPAALRDRRRGFHRRGAVALLGQPRARFEQHSLHRLARRPRLPVRASPTIRIGSSSRTTATSPAFSTAAPIC